MSETFEIRLLDGPDERFVYYDHDEAQSGDVERVVTTEWTDHDVDDLDRVLSMLEWMGYRCEVRGLVREPAGPGMTHWAIDPDAPARDPRVGAPRGGRDE